MRLGYGRKSSYLTFVIRMSNFVFICTYYYTKCDCLLWCGSLSMSCRFICISSHGNLPLPLQYFHQRSGQPTLLCVCLNGQCLGKHLHSVERERTLHSSGIAVAATLELNDERCSIKSNFNDSQWLPQVCKHVLPGFGQVSALCLVACETGCILGPNLLNTIIRKKLPLQSSV